MKSEQDRQQMGALEAWERFDEQVNDDVLRAVSGAFAVVACSDGTLDESEIEIFLDMIKDTRAFAKVDLGALEQHFRALGRAIEADFEAGRRRAFEEIALVKGYDKRTALVVSAAQIAILADSRLQAAEETALRQICEILGLDPDVY